MHQVVLLSTGTTLNFFGKGGYRNTKKGLPSTALYFCRLLPLICNL